MKWTKPLYKREEVNRAAKKALLDNKVDESTRNNALVIVNNWRASHAYPLQAIKMTLKRRACKVDGSAVIAQRMKRLPSIKSKLGREPTMMLSQMADIGGCRAILTNIKDVDLLVASYQKAKSKNPRRHEEIRIRDYISNPKVDGYRGIHIIVKYRSKALKHKVYNGLKIEIQIRSKLQHAWATAVEIVDAFTGQGLKSGLKLNLGDPDWRRFFVLMSGAIAIRERKPVVPGAPDKVSLKKELTMLGKKLQVEKILSGLNTAISAIQKDPNVVSYLLVLDLDQMLVKAFPFFDQSVADESYLMQEKEIQDNPKIFAVLVSVESINALRTAYPNYYLDATEFLRVYKKAIA